MSQQTQKKGLARKAVEGMVWLLASSGARAGLSAVVIAILARLLSPSDFGLIAAANIVIGFADIFAYFGIGSALIQGESTEQAHVATGFTACILTSIGVALLTFFLSPLIAQVLNMAELERILRVLCILFPINSVSAICASILQREFNYRKLAVADITAYLIGYGCTGVLLAYLGFGVWALVFAGLGLSLLKASILFSLQPHPLGLTLNRHSLKKLVFYGGGFTVANIFNFTALSADNLIVGRILGAGALGIYSRAFSMMDTTNGLLGGVLNAVFFPAVARIQNDRQQLAGALRRGLTLSGVVFLPVCVASIILAPELVRILLGPKWTGVVLPFRILAAGMYFRLGFITSEILARGSGRVYSNAWRQGLYALLVVLAAWNGCRWGVTGVAFFVTIVIILNFFAMLQLALKITGLSVKRISREACKSCFIAGIIGLEIYCIAHFCREMNVSAVLCVLLSTIFASATFLTLLVKRTDFVFGEDGNWVLKQLDTYLPMRRFCSGPLENKNQ
jgi:PST family polysaccharide transporter